MSPTEKATILLTLDERWAKQQKTPPIEAFLSAFLGINPDVKLISQNAASCTLVARLSGGRRDELERQISHTLQSSLSIQPADPVARWQIRPLKEDGSDMPASLSDEDSEEEDEAAFADEELRAQLRHWELRLILDADWVLARRGDAVLPMDDFLQQLERAFTGVRIRRRGLTDCFALIQALNLDELNDRINTILQDMGAANAVEALELQAASAEVLAEAAEQPAPQPSAQADDQAKTPSPPPGVLDQMKALIGGDGFWELAWELTEVAAQLHAHGTLDAFARRCYLFSIGDGCGLSTQLRLLAELLTEYKLFSFAPGNPVSELAAGAPLSEMLDAVSARQGDRELICFDLREWMDKLRTPEFRSLLQRLRKTDGNQIYVFRIPFVDEETRLDILRRLSDMLTVREVVTPPFTLDQFAVYAARLLQARGYRMEEAGWQTFEERVIAEKSDGHFYGLRTVQKLVDEMLYQKHLCAARHPVPGEEKLIRGEHAASPLFTAPDKRPAMEQLDDLIGIQPIRDRIEEVLAQIEMASSSQAKLRPSLHMRFVGNPGTGKTTVARILGQLLRERGVLSKGYFFEYAGRDFCGQFIGETAPKTAAMCRDAYGSVLFIDEAYSLYRGDRDSRDYGREAIDTLIAQMENHRRDFVVIMAGYPDDMEMLMDSNMGLSSRMPYTINFPNYGREELFQIFMHMVTCSFSYEPALETAAREYFHSLSDELLDAKEFANARFVRNLFERTWGKASVRHRLEPEGELTLCACDFDKAAADREFTELQKKKTRKVGF